LIFIEPITGHSFPFGEVNVDGAPTEGPSRLFGVPRGGGAFVLILAVIIKDVVVQRV
jgi:hypothetical protein